MLTCCCHMYAIIHISCILKHDKHNCRYRFFHPRHKGQWPPTSKDFHTRCYPLPFYPILSLEKEPECRVPNKGTTGTISITSWYDAVLDLGLNHGPPALEASTTRLSSRRSFVVVKKCYCRYRFNAFDIFVYFGLEAFHYIYILNKSWKSWILICLR